MGNKGSSSFKARYCDALLTFTQWGPEELRDLLLRANKDLGNTFALRRFEFDYLLSPDLVGFFQARELFERVFDTESKKVIDKLEVLCLICLLSRLPNKDKVEYLFDIFNFNDKGYLLESELMLLFVSVVNGALKGDRTISVATAQTLKLLARYAINKYGAYNMVVSIRKPQLVTFVADTLEVRAFIDAWKGHLGKVLLSANEKWRDPNFPANELSIAPSDDWYKKGLPPPHFVYWLRLCDVLPIIEHRFLFSHTTDILKNAARSKVYGGNGVLGEGYLIQGFLADKWFLNAVGVLTANPKLLFGCFSTTEQEDIGRYCCKFFEGVSWRSVFVDDRIPCTPEAEVLFSRSLDHSEYFVMILEKALAKYFGSYGHLGLAGIRGDATPYALRMLTGGHPIRLKVPDYEWTTVASDCSSPDKDGASLVESTFREGSLVAFGVSEVQLAHRFTLGKPMQTRSQAPPGGYLFPMIGTRVDEDNYKYVVLRDPWGVMPAPQRCRVSASADETFGFCRTFDVRMEDIARDFDTVFLCRFPDLLRPDLDLLRLKPFHTEYCSQITRGPRRPAVFVLTVVDKELLPPKPVDTGMPSLAAMKREENAIRRRGEVKKEKPPSLFDEPADKKADETGAEKARANVRKAKLEEFATATNARFSGVDDLVDIALTFSSEWGISGEPSAGACTRLAIVPSKLTRSKWKLRSIMMKNMKIKKELLERKQKEEAERLLIALANQGLSDEDAATFGGSKVSEPNNNDGSKPTSIVGAATDAVTTEASLVGGSQQSATLAGPGTVTTMTTEQDLGSRLHLEAERYDILIAEESSWVSRTVKLLPGRYYIFADVSYSPADYTALMRSLLPKDVSHIPWYENKDLNNHVVHLQLSSHGRFTVTTRDDPPDTTDAAVSSVPRNNVDLTMIPVQPQLWPFASERQVDSCSRELHDMLFRLKREVRMLDGKFAHSIEEIKSYKSALSTFREQESSLITAAEDTAAAAVAAANKKSSKKK